MSNARPRATGTSLRDLAIAKPQARPDVTAAETWPDLRLGPKHGYPAAPEPGLRENEAGAPESGPTAPRPLDDFWSAPAPTGSPNAARPRGPGSVRYEGSPRRGRRMTEAAETWAVPGQAQNGAGGRGARTDQTRIKLEEGPDDPGPARGLRGCLRI